MRFGEVHFSEAQFPPEFLERYIPWKPGDYYSPDELLALQQRLVDADYFSTVSAQPDLSNTDSLDVPINVSLSPAKRTIYTAGVYISTDTGPGVKLGMQRRWVNDKGHKFQHGHRLRAAPAGHHHQLPHSAAGAERQEPELRRHVSGREHGHEPVAQRAHRRERIPQVARVHAHGRRAVSRGHVRDRGRGPLSRDLLLRGSARSRRKQANDFFFPRRGCSVAFALRFAPEGVLSDTSFTQITADGKYIRAARAAPAAASLRASLGAMAVDDFDQLPPELRFFAGGDRSIRGFDYQQLGTTNAAGQGDRRHVSRRRAASNSSATSCRSGARRFSWMAATRSAPASST